MSRDATPPGVLVTGGAGFLGSHLVDRLLAESRPVDVIDDLSTGSLANLSEARSHAAGDLKFHHVDVRSPDLTELFQRRRPGIVYHLAVIAPGQSGPEGVEIAVAGTINVLDAARLGGVRKVVVALPALALYGAVSARDMPLKEGCPFTPVTLSGVAARTVVDLLSVYRADYSLEFTALAMTEVYGPRQRPSDGTVAAIVDAMVEGSPPRVPGDGRQGRDFLYVDDAVDALVRAGERGSGLVVNVGSGEITAVRTVVDFVHPPGTVLQSSGPKPVGEPDRFSVSPVRARIHLSWAPWTTLREGVAMTRAVAEAQRNRSS